MSTIDRRGNKQERSTTRVGPEQRGVGSIMKMWVAKGKREDVNKESISIKTAETANDTERDDVYKKKSSAVCLPTLIFARTVMRVLSPSFFDVRWQLSDDQYCS